MPPRSNLFQAVVYSLHRYLARDFQVTESVMLPDTRTQELREVDVVVRGTLSGYEVVIGIECRDHKRPATVEWVEQMHAKHADLPTDKLILVSRSGFTESAKEKAENLKIQVMQLDAPDPELGLKIVGKVKQLLVLSVSARTRLFYRRSPGTSFKEITYMKSLEKLYDGAGKIQVAGQDVIDAFMGLPQTLPAMLEVDSGHGTLVELECREGVHVLRDGQKIPITGLLLVTDLEKASTPLDIESGRFQKYSIAYGRAISGEGEITLMIVEEPNRSPFAGVTIRRGREVIEEEELNLPSSTNVPRDPTAFDRIARLFRFSKQSETIGRETGEAGDHPLGGED